MTAAAVFMSVHFTMKLSDWDRKQGIGYLAAWRRFPGAAGRPWAGLRVMGQGSREWPVVCFTTYGG